MTHTFDGEKYVERERRSADVPPEGTKLFVGDVSFQTGIPLEPRDEERTETGLDTDAKVPGTDFHATGQPACARYEGQPMSHCDFGGKRKGGGDAELTVLWPDGGTRVIVGG